MMRRAARWLVYAAGLCAFVPWAPLPLTQYYEYWMHVAFVERRQFGSDIHATYGPLGFIGLPFYYPATYPLLIVCNIVLFVLAAAFLARCWRVLTARAHAPTWWVVPVLLLPAFVPFDPVWTPALFVPYMLLNALVLAYFIEPDALPPGWIVVLGVLLALFVLMKGTFIALTCVGVAAIAWHEVVRRRRVPLLLTAFAAALPALWVMAGQRPGHLVSYLTGSFDIVAGYKDGAALSTPGSHRLALIFAAASLCIWSTTVAGVARRGGWRALGPAVVLGATLFVMFQHAFVRADVFHALPASLALVGVTLVAAPALVRRGIERARAPLVAATVLASVVVVLACAWLRLGAPSLRVVSQAPGDLWSLLTRGTTPLDQRLAAHLDDARRECPVPGPKLPVDTSSTDFGLAPVDASAAMVRPTVIDYMALSPALSRRNRAYFEDAAGPAAVVIDARRRFDDWFPASVDSQSLLALKTHFEWQASAGTCLVLERRPVARAIELVHIERREARFGEEVIVSGSVYRPIWTRIDVDPTLAGRLFALLYKPVRTSITVTTSSGSAAFRLSPAIARQGVMLSPLFNDAAMLKAFYSSEAPSADPNRVMSFRISHDDATGWYFRDRIAIELFEVAFR